MSELKTTKKIKQIGDALLDLKVKEIKELADWIKKELAGLLKEEYGIEPATAAVAVASVAGAEPKEEKTIFDVVLKSVGSSKLGVIKVVKGILALGLKEAKDLVESAPQTIKESVPKEEAERIKKELTDAGAEVELK